MTSSSVFLTSRQKKIIRQENKLQRLFQHAKKRKDVFHGRCEAVQNGGFYAANIDGLHFFPCNKKAPPEGSLITVTQHKNKFSYHIDTPVLATDFRGSAFRKLQANGLCFVQRLHDRSLFFRGVRDFFDGYGFQELQTPTLVESPGIEKYLEVFSTQYEDFDGTKRNFFLPTSPEFSLKEALSSGLPKIYEIAKCFRNAGECSQTHRPEFFMLEWYRAYEDYHVIMEDCVQLALYLAKLLYGKTKVTFRDHKADLSCYDRFTVRELFAAQKIELNYFSTQPNKFEIQAREALGIFPDNSSTLTKEDLFFKVMLDRIEPFLGMERPTFLCEYPLEMTPLSEVSSESSLYGKRFELYLCGVELANGYGELVNAEEQERRFIQVLKERDTVGGSSLVFPSRFIQAMKQGIPPCSGVALGLERLLMILAGTESLGDTLLVDSFPEE